MKKIVRSVIVGAFMLSLAAGGAAWGQAGTGKPSVAERAVFMGDHLHSTTPATTLEYRFTRRGSLDPAFEDMVKLLILPQDAAGGAAGGRPTAVVFLSGDRRVELAPIGNAAGNPVIVYFLERDIREMERLTGGKANYHRKRIRLALAEDEVVEATEIEWNGAKVPAKRVVVTPYVDDELKQRYGRFVGKRYEFVLSDGIPGSLYRIATTVPGAGGEPLVEETLTFSGVKQGVSPPPAPGKS